VLGGLERAEGICTGRAPPHVQHPQMILVLVLLAWSRGVWLQQQQQQQQQSQLHGSS
jgi:hypothetical protein